MMSMLDAVEEHTEVNIGRYYTAREGKIMRLMRRSIQLGDDR